MTIFRAGATPSTTPREKSKTKKNQKIKKKSSKRANKEKREGARNVPPWKIELCTVTSENWPKRKREPGEKVWENGWAAQKVNGFKGGGRAVGGGRRVEG